MSTNSDTLRRGLVPLAAALTLALAPVSQAAAQHSRRDATPPSSSHSSPGTRSSVGDSSDRSPSSSSPSVRGDSSSRGSGSGSSDRQRIDRDTRDYRYRGGRLHGSRYGYRGYYPNYGWYGSWGSPWYWWGFYGYGYPYYPYHTAVTVYPNSSYGDLGALDIDISPERAEVYVDGQQVGVADDFDGFPTFLWLEEGTYDVVFYLPGFRTLARQYTIYPGLVIDVGDNLEPGESVRPENLGTKTHERRDARLRDDRERERAWAEGRLRPRVQPRSGRDDWRERSPGAVIAPRESDDGEPRDVRGEPATLTLKVEPEDASVYLDGRFIGTGEEISNLRSGLIVDAGSHRLEIVRPGRRSETRTFVAEAGGEVELEVELEEQ